MISRVALRQDWSAPLLGDQGVVDADVVERREAHTRGRVAVRTGCVGALVEDDLDGVDGRHAEHETLGPGIGSAGAVEDDSPPVRGILWRRRGVAVEAAEEVGVCAGGY